MKFTVGRWKMEINQSESATCSSSTYSMSSRGTRRRISLCWVNLELLETGKLESSEKA